MPKTITENTILRGLRSIARDGLNGEISARSLSNMVCAGQIQIQKIGGRYTSTPARVREAFETAMNGGARR